MCFEVRNSKKQVAKKDIYVLKFTMLGNNKNRFTSNFFNQHKYLANKLTKKVSLEIKYSSIYEGYHSYCSRRDMAIMRPFRYGLFVIPKGTSYYKFQDQIVSERIKYLRPVNVNDSFIKKREFSYCDYNLLFDSRAHSPKKK